MAVAFDVAVEVNTTREDLEGLTPSLWLRPEELVEDYGHRASGTEVTLWRDASGNGWHGSAPVGYGPLWYSALASSNWYHPGVRFTGAAWQQLILPTASSVLGANGIGSVYVLGRADVGNVGNFWSVFSATSTSNSTGVRPLASLKAHAWDGTADAVTIAGDIRVALPSGGTPFHLVAWIKEMGPNMLYGSYGAGTSGLDGLVATANGALTDISAGLILGTEQAGTSLSGAITEIIFFPAVHLAAQREQVARYFRKKYGLLETDEKTPSTWFVLPDVIAKNGIQCQYGMGGTGIEDRVADTGSMSFTLDNSERNTAGVVGYYSPENEDSPYWWDIGTEVRLKITYGASVYYKWRGIVDDVSIVPSVTGVKSVAVNCVDWMDMAARSQLSGLPIQVTKRSDQIFQELLYRVHPPPPSIVLGYGQDTYAYALDNSEEESLSLMTEFQRLANSELGFIYVKGDQTRGGSLVFESRTKRGSKTASLFTLDKNELLDMQTTYAREDIINEALVQIFPRRVDSAATSVVFSLQDKPVLQRNTTSTFFGPFRDPNSGRFVRVGATGMVAPVATTDYTLNAAVDGTGADLTSQLSVVASFAASGVTFNVTNNGPLDGYLTKLQVRGQGVYSDESVIFRAEDVDSQMKFGKRTTRFDMPYQSSPSIGLDAAYFILNQGKSALSRLRSATFLGNSNDTTATAALAREISDRVSVSENVTWGESSGSDVIKDYFINGVALDISPGKLIRCTWQLAPADNQAYWILQLAGFTELGLTTRLSYGLFSPAWQLDVSQLGVDTIINNG